MKSRLNNSKAKPNPLINLEAAFEAMPGYSALLATNAPVYTILAVTNEYLKPSGKRKEDIIGKGLFEAFPSNPKYPDSTGENKLKLSFQKVNHTKQPDVFILRYDISNQEDGFSEFYWRANNKPVFDGDGNVMYILHTAENITHEIKAQQNEEKLKGLQQAYNLFRQAPMAIHIIKGKELIIDFANPPTLQLWGKGEEVIGKKLGEAIPEIQEQGIAELLHGVRETEQPYEAYEAAVQLIR